jgi:hypothetical protein
VIEDHFKVPIFLFFRGDLIVPHIDITLYHLGLPVNILSNEANFAMPVGLHVGLHNEVKPLIMRLLISISVKVENKAA